MERTTTIPVKMGTKADYDRLRGERKHDPFIRELIAIYQRIPPVERVQLLAQDTKRQSPIPQKG